MNIQIQLLVLIFLTLLAKLAFDIYKFRKTSQEEKERLEREMMEKANKIADQIAERAARTAINFYNATISKQ
jgi:ClpP class serine protease